MSKLLKTVRWELLLLPLFCATAKSARAIMSPPPE